MAFVKSTPKTTGNDPRSFTVKTLPGVSFIITMASDGACKGFQVGGGKFTTVKTPGALINPAYLHPDVVAAAVAASEAVDKAFKAGKYKAVEKEGYTAFEYKG